MAGISQDRDPESQEIIDLLKATRDHFADDYDGPLDVLSARHRYPVMNQWFQEDKLLMESGTMYTEAAVLDRDGNLQAKHVRPYEPVDPAVVDNTVKVTVPLRKLTAWWSIERSEVLKNRQPDGLFKLDKARKIKMQADMAKTLEQRAFKAMDSSADDLNPYGVPYWIPIITTTQAADTSVERGEHQGGRPSYEDGNSITAGCAGIDPDDARYALWKSYCGRWAHDDILNDFGEDDVQRFIRMHRHLYFDVPLNAEDWKKGVYDNFQGYVTENLLDAMEKKARLNNDSLQADLGKFSGVVVVKGVPIQWGEEMDSWVNSDSNPTETFLLLNHEYFRPIVMEGDYFRETGPMNDVRNHDVFTTFSDLQYNFLETNRRLGGGRLDVEPMT